MDILKMNDETIRFWKRNKDYLSIQETINYWNITIYVNFNEVIEDDSPLSL